VTRLSEVEARVASLAGALGEPPTSAKGAVSLILRDAGPVEILLIERAVREGDPWSGQLAFPGGGRHATDRDLLETAVRETEEEVRVDLSRDARLVGRLPPRAPANRVEWLVVPFVFSLTHAVNPVPGEEAARAFWTPLDALPDRLYVATIEVPGRRLELPAFEVGGKPLWGFSFRVLCDLFDVVGWPGDEGRPSIANLK
jgi:8-oxo-dGTP pyrophosphatase MutT (NUDIX family)